MACDIFCADPKRGDVAPPAPDADRIALQENGYVVVPSLLDLPMLERLRSMTDRELERQEREHFEQFRFHGSMLPLSLSEEDVQLLVRWQPTLSALQRLGFASPKWLSGYTISKPPKAPSLWWHQDWWAWDEPVSFSDQPAQLFVMYYLSDVGPSNGCLRVIPGSHRKRHQLHAELPAAHSIAISEAAPNGIAHSEQPDERPISVRAGDAVVGDARLLHATHANMSDARRTCITAWYLPTFDALSDSIKAYVVQHPSLPPAGWWRDPNEAIPQVLRDLLPSYEGSVEAATYNRVPPEHW